MWQIRQVDLGKRKGTNDWAARSEVDNGGSDYSNLSHGFYSTWIRNVNRLSITDKVFVQTGLWEVENCSHYM